MTDFNTEVKEDEIRASIAARDEDLPWATAPTDGEAVADILAMADTKEIVIQTEEDLGPKDADILI